MVSVIIREEIILLGIELIALIGSIIFIVLNGIKIRKKKINSGRLIIDIMFFIYFLCVLNITIFPIPFQKTFIDSYLNTLGSDPRFQYNLIPFMTVVDSVKNAFTYNTYLLELKNIGGNLILLTPLGIYVHFIRRNLGMKNIFILGLGTAVVIELIQLSISLWLGYSYRSFDVDDLILNTFGFIVGYKSFTLIKKEISKENFLPSNNQLKI